MFNILVFTLFALNIVYTFGDTGSTYALWNAVPNMKAVPNATVPTFIISLDFLRANNREQENLEQPKLPELSASQFAPKLQTPPIGKNHVGNTKVFAHDECVIWDGLGFCRNNQSLIDHIRDDVCVARHCLYSSNTKQYIDLDSLLGSDKDTNQWKGDQNECIFPSGGQTSTIDDIPVLSFIFTIHNNGAMASKALIDTFKTAHEVESAEFIIVDDGTTDKSNLILESVVDKLIYLFGTKITIITNLKTVGYGASNNIALQSAYTEFSVLLNADIMVHPGWLSMLMYTMQTSPLRVGMVGPLMIGGDGKVMEAGGLVQTGGVPANMFRSESPLQLTQFNTRVVDYISAACVLIRRQVFLDMGLFDPKFEPAYYEDTDAALTMMEGGYNVILNPLAVATHYEGSSYGTSSLKQSLMDNNQVAFAEKHKKILDKYCPVLNDHSLHTFARQKNRILFLDDIVPMPDRDAGSIRAMNLLKILARAGYSVTMEPRSSGYLNNTRNILNLLADGVNVVRHGTLAEMVNSVSADSVQLFCPYNAIIISRRDVCVEKFELAKKLCPDVPIIYDTVDVHFIREQRHMALEAKQLRSKRINRNAIISERRMLKYQEDRKMEIDFMKDSNITFVVSKHELAVLTELLPNVDVRILSNIYDVRKGTKVSKEARSGAVFVGNMCHPPNIDAIEFILSEILDKGLPDDFIINIVLSRSTVCAPAELMKILRTHASIRLHLDVTNKELEYIHRSSLVVLAPLRYGAGVKGKVNYGLLHGIPVIGTQIASEGMNLENRKNIYLASNGAEFIGAISDLSSNETLWNELQAGGLQIMSDYFGTDIASDIVVRSLQDLGAGIKNLNTPNECSFLEMFSSSYYSKALSLNKSF